MSWEKGLSDCSKKAFVKPAIVGVRDGKVNKLISSRFILFNVVATSHMWLWKLEI